jgi:hypothetical protein
MRASLFFCPLDAEGAPARRDRSSIAWGDYPPRKYELKDDPAAVAA